MDKSEVGLQSLGVMTLMATLEEIQFASAFTEPKGSLRESESSNVKAILCGKARLDSLDNFAEVEIPD
jgi:hypothetical protein